VGRSSVGVHCPAGASLRGGIGFEGCVVGRSWDVVWDVGGRGRLMSVRVGFVAGVMWVQALR